MSQHAGHESPEKPGRRLELSNKPITDTGCQCLVNPWIASRLPAWVLKLSDTSRQIRDVAGVGPFRQLRRHGRLQLGQCLATGAGQMKRTNYLLHVGLTPSFGRPSAKIVEAAIAEVFMTADKVGTQTLALPLMGYEQGYAPEQVFQWIVSAAGKYGADLHAVVVVVTDPAVMAILQPLLQAGEDEMETRLAQKAAANAEANSGDPAGPTASGPPMLRFHSASAA